MMMNKITFLKRQKKFLSILLLLICCSYCYSQSTCDCKEFIYLNEPGADAVLKFEVVSGPAVALTNVVSMTDPDYPAFIQDANLISFPHGNVIDGNGYLWVGDSQSNGDPIRRFNCEGDYLGMAGTPGLNDITNTSGTLTNLIYANGFIYGTATDATANNALVIIKYDPCTGMPVGNIACLDERHSSALTWGIWYDQMTDYVYISDSGNRGQIYKITLAELDAAISDPTICLEPFITRIRDDVMGATNTLNRVFGVTSDAAGNIYVVIREPNSGGDESQIIKYDGLTGAPLATSPISTTDYSRLMGIVYSMTTDQIYASTASNNGTDCISVFDTNLNYLGTGALNSETTDGVGKGIAIIKECCPLAGQQTFNYSYCAEDFPGQIDINEFYECEGVVCEAPWVLETGAMGITYDDCKQAITELSASFEATGGCVTFTKTWDGGTLGGTAKCDPYTITINIEIVKKATSTIDAPSECGDVISSEITNEPGQTTDIITYQWQQSPTAIGPFVDISGATSATYSPTNPSATQCFRLITTTTGSCLDSDNVMCSDISNIVKFTINPTPDCGGFPANPAGN